MTHQLTPDTASTFMRFNMTAEDEKMALGVSPLFLAYLQNKIEAYANASLNAELPYHEDPKLQVKAILELERLKNHVAAYQELLYEIVNSQTQE
jgi:hypothetical protein